MNEEERIIEVTGRKVRTPITWLKDPTRHLLKIKAVNAKDPSDEDGDSSQSDEQPPGDIDSPKRTD